MARNVGIPAYKGKTVRRSIMVTPATARKVRGAVKRTGKSESDIFEHGAALLADRITKRTHRFGPDGYREPAPVWNPPPDKDEVL